jgi:hypothetical protein
LPVAATIEVTAIIRPCRHCAGEAKGSSQIDVEHRLPIRVGHAQRQRVSGQTGVVDQDVDMPERRLGILNQLFAGLGIGKIGESDMGAPTEIGGEPLEGFGTRARQHQRRPLGMQRPGDRPADAAGGAGHQRRLTRQIEHRPSVFRGLRAVPRPRSGRRRNAPLALARCVW